MYFKTFGCRSNLYDTQVMINSLKGYSLIEDAMQADIIVINSCTVTNKADREVRSYAKKYSQLGKKVIFTGCGVKHLGENLFQKNLAFTVFAHSYKENITDIISSNKRILLAKDKTHKHIDSTLIPNIIGKVRAFIKIQEGCNFSCSYCIIPSVRGMARSFPQEHILEQIKLLASNHVSEVILTGTNIGSYGFDTNTHIADLIAMIHDINGIKRVRLGSLEPSQIDSKFLEILQLPKLERHLHIALQHTSPTMLKIMNRKNTFQKDLELFEYISSMGFSLGTDYIVGHYGESEEIFQEAVLNLEKLPLTHIHPFIYSPRTGTKSAINKDKLQSINGAISKKRLKIIQDIVKKKNEKFRVNILNKQIPLKILIDGQKQISLPNKQNTQKYIWTDIKVLDTKQTNPPQISQDRHNKNNENFAFSDSSATDVTALQQCYTGLDQYFNRIFIPNDLLQNDIQKGSWLDIKNYAPCKEYVNANIAINGWDS